jgi:hypothetical protein
MSDDLLEEYLEDFRRWWWIGEVMIVNGTGETGGKEMIDIRIPTRTTDNIECPA